MTVPHPVLGRSPYLDNSGEHGDADIAYVAGYEWALSAYDDANRLTRNSDRLNGLNGNLPGRGPTTFHASPSPKPE